MIATTPSGTRTFEICKPFGRVNPSVISPTGSGRDATWRSPSAMLCNLLSLSRSRSSWVAVASADSATATSRAFAARMCSRRAINKSAAACNAVSFAAVPTSASTRDAAFARAPNSAMVGAFVDVLMGRQSTGATPTTRRSAGTLGPT